MFMGSEVFRSRLESLDGGVLREGASEIPLGCVSGICESLHQIAASLGNAIDAKDHSTSSHSRQVADLARCLALRAGMSTSQAEVIHIAGHLHDIGKIGIPDEVLSKRTPLTDAEWAMIRQHPVTGAKIVAPVHIMNGSTGIAKMILHHHERWDGRGYPHRLRGESIPLGARILCLADSFSAMMESRAYRNRLTLGGSIEELRRNAGSQFDPKLCGLMVDMLWEAGVADEFCTLDLLVTRIMCERVLRKTDVRAENASGENPGVGCPRTEELW
ncbi:HD-GYP domain-containing protein [Desulfonatronum sp. SC1]|uniref:HD-GYP domain-containing protein n=1 Tax=Desulfonatronum sp. SC1 TaxID=2109626 RepID=UPI001E46A0E4|nr:HD-GYP domain-containing protein [Desulfonatronum sp. SC1]